MSQEIIDVIRKLVSHVFQDKHAEREALLAKLDNYNNKNNVVEVPQPVAEPDPTYEELLAKHHEARRGASV